MGYPVDLDDLSEAQLIKELNRRYDLREKGLCDYCERPVSTVVCRYAERHTLLERSKDTDRRLRLAQRIINR